MRLFQTPANIGADDFVRAANNSADKLAKEWDEQRARNIVGFQRIDGEHIRGACDISPNYFDVRTNAADATSPVPWNGFPRALDRWHKVLSAPTPDKQRTAETTADILIETLYWWEIGDDGKPALAEFPAHIVHLLDPKARRLARRLRLGSPTGAEVPMTHRQQDEYIEWHADHDEQGRLVRLSFSCEPPEYWDFLAAREPELVLTLYRDLVGPQVAANDLFFAEDVLVFGEDNAGNAKWLPLYAKGSYNRFNKWTTTHGSVHLTHPANTLGAEITLAAVASLAWQSDDDGPNPAYDDDPALTRIACAGYGEINRSSDPSIGEQVGIQVRAGNRVALTDPMGLYIGSIDLKTLERDTPTGRVSVAAAEVLDIKRGIDDAHEPRKLHFKLAAPAGADWTLSDCFIDNRRLERGGQVARKIGMVLYADVINGGADQALTKCQTTLYCRHENAPGYFGGFSARHGTCELVTDEAWAEQIPFEGAVAETGAKISTFSLEGNDFFAATGRNDLKAILDGGAEAQVGVESLAPPPISTDRAKKL